jgi:hypothetical protein
VSPPRATESGLNQLNSSVCGGWWLVGGWVGAGGLLQHSHAQEGLCAPQLSPKRCAHNEEGGCTRSSAHDNRVGVLMYYFGFESTTLELAKF